VNEKIALCRYGLEAAQEKYEAAKSKVAEAIAAATAAADNRKVEAERLADERQHQALLEKQRQEDARLQPERSRQAVAELERQAERNRLALVEMERQAQVSAERERQALAEQERQEQRQLREKWAWLFVVLVTGVIALFVFLVWYFSRLSAPPPRSKKAPSPLQAIVLWALTGVAFVFSVSAASPVAGVLCTALLISAAITTGNYQTKKSLLNPRKPNGICDNCGTLLIMYWKNRPKDGSICAKCGSVAIVPLETPRGQELLATYHGSVTAKERVETGDEAIEKLLRSLEPIPASGSIALELEKLVGLVRIGAISHAEWQRAKALYLGQPKAKQEDSLARIQQLHGLYQSGALSESEFNMTKWDILSKGMG
jgi:hypothetical protein